MSSITNINNNSSVVNVGRTTPVSPGQQPASKSIPVVVASDQPAIPVEEQNKIQSEVALSLLGIPRAEVALGIFADVNTYDVNPSEWSSVPEVYVNGHGTKHLPEEAGALVEAPRDQTAVLTSKRFFRYQPGRVSAATFGIKSTVSETDFAKNPTIRKYGIYDKYDGYYWETRQSGKGDNFTVVRRTQSLYKSPVTPFGVSGQLLRGSSVDPSIDLIQVEQSDDYRITGKAPDVPSNTTRFTKESKILKNSRFKIAEAAWLEAMENASFAAHYNGMTPEEQAVYKGKCERDVDYWLDMILMDISTNRPTGTLGYVDAHTSLNTHNYETSLAVANRDAQYEIILHTGVKAVIQGQDQQGRSDLFANLVTSAVLTEVASLYQIVIDFFTRVNDATTYPNNVDGDFEDYSQPQEWGAKAQIETLFDARKHYWAYYVSKYDAQGNPITYINSDLDDAFFTIEDIMYKCERDVGYIIDGYKDDLSGGGNAATKYNASMYLKGTGMSIYTQVDGAVPREIERHTHLKDIIVEALNRSEVDWYGGVNFSDFTSRIYNGTLEGGSGLANIIIRNFTVEDTSTTFYGEKAVVGNLVAYRDGLVMVHAAVYDPSLLKEQKTIVAYANASTGTCKLTDGVVTFGQHVKYVGEENGSLVKNKLYQVNRVKGPKGNEFTLVDPITGSAVGPAANSHNAAFITVVPFIFPNEYNPTLIAGDEGAYNYPEGAMFPFMYTTGTGNLPVPENQNYIGYIDTGLNPSTVTGNNLIKTQIDSVNFEPEYINWIKNNVDPEYWAVYEYRVPRSRFSTDKLNNRSDNLVVYSDVATGTQGRVRPGQPVLDETGVQLINESVYEFDFTKVTMLKIEFSWYGAVGALFLAYVPVGNGEARWVRVHHLRASNQLKISSLGNATLPITYNVYGGGSQLTLGDGESFLQGYETDSHHIVKYGASYYIDGGDRGTVRLYSHTNEYAEDVYGTRVNMGSPTYSYDTALQMYYMTRTPNPIQVPNVYFMNSNVKTNVRTDSIIDVVWTTEDRIYFSAEPQGSTLTLLTKRSNSIFGLETKQNIISSQGQKVRNRVQVYPVKLSSANFGNKTAKLSVIKTPKFQTQVATNGSFELSQPHTITPQNNALNITAGSLNYITDGEETWGWFRATIAGAGNAVTGTVLAKIYRQGNDYYVALGETYNGTITLSGSFLNDLRFNTTGDVVSGTKMVTEKEGLSSIVIASNEQVPIPGTGINIATLYIEPGTDQFELDTYFDYNKEYLSFPLTDTLESLYFIVDEESTIDIDNVAPSGSVSIGVTWEEQ